MNGEDARRLQLAINELQRKMDPLQARLDRLLGGEPTDHGAMSHGIVVWTAQEAAEILINAFELDHGEIHIRVADGRLTVLQAGRQYKAPELRGVKIGPP